MRRAAARRAWARGTPRRMGTRASSSGSFAAACACPGTPSPPRRARATSTSSGGPMGRAWRCAPRTWSQPRRAGTRTSSPSCTASAWSGRLTPGRRQHARGTCPFSPGLGRGAFPSASRSCPARPPEVSPRSSSGRTRRARAGASMGLRCAARPWCTVTAICCPGPRRAAAPGTPRRASSPQRRASSAPSSGCGPSGALGTSTFPTPLRASASSRCCSGCTRTAWSWTRAPARRLRGAGMWRCSPGCGPRAASGTSACSAPPTA
mmetsp:Transcript_23410/g.68922  ORF Transcript_23410/g.68922 Transcript_23410/m.68922 type:complete len:264 (-) Transcript_23410:289-1080(-)